MRNKNYNFLLLYFHEIRITTSYYYTFMFIIIQKRSNLSLPKLYYLNLPVCEYYNQRKKKSMVSRNKIMSKTLVNKLLYSILTIQIQSRREISQNIPHEAFPKRTDHKLGLIQLYALPFTT